ncbi:MAG: transposase family protein [Phycisphaerales bacterium]|nr:transposase family protein [Phycisphaerales bacterium]
MEEGNFASVYTAGPKLHHRRPAGVSTRSAAAVSVPHSGHRSGVARRSYPHIGQCPASHRNHGTIADRSSTPQQTTVTAPDAKQSSARQVVARRESIYPRMPPTPTEITSETTAVTLNALRLVTLTPGLYRSARVSRTNIVCPPMDVLHPRGIGYRPKKTSCCFARAGHVWRDRVLDPAGTLALFVLQILHGNTAISHPRHLSGQLVVSASSYCEARARKT